MKRGAVIAAIAVAFLFEAVALMLLAQDGGPRAYLGAFASHIAAAGFGAEALRRHYGPLMYVGWAVGLIFPIFGPIGIIAIATAPARRTRSRTSAEQRRRAAAHAELEKRRAEQQVDGKLGALVDALHDRDADVRVAAIDALGRDTSREAVKVLSAARDNTVYDVRVRAVEGLQRISQHFADHITTARLALRETPRSILLNSQLARLCLDYAQTGIEDEAVVNVYLSEAAERARDAIVLGRVDEDVHLILAKALRLMGDPAGAEAIYRELTEGGGGSKEAVLGVLSADSHDATSIRFRSCRAGPCAAATPSLKERNAHCSSGSRTDERGRR